MRSDSGLEGSPGWQLHTTYNNFSPDLSLSILLPCWPWRSPGPSPDFALLHRVHLAAGRTGEGPAEGGGVGERAEYAEPLGRVLVTAHLACRVRSRVARAPRQRVPCTVSKANLKKVSNKETATSDDPIMFLPMKKSWRSSNGSAGRRTSVFSLRQALYPSSAMLRPPWSAKFSPKVKFPSTFASASR